MDPATGAAPAVPQFTIDRPNQLLWRGDTPIKVPPKVFQLLAYLRDNPGRILEYEELLDAVWPREFVQPEILKTYIKTIRRLLEDDAQTPHFIETRPRSGYSFIGKLPEHGPKGGGLPSRLIGREAVLASLRDAHLAALSGERRIVFLVGEAGIGKTRAIDEFLAGVPAQDSRIHRLDCASARHAPDTFSPARELAAVLSSCGEPVAPDAESLSRGLEEHATAVPAVLIVENLQWADLVTIETLSRLAYGRGPLPLLVVASYRASMPNDLRCPARTLVLDLIVHGVAQELRLRALAAADVKKLILASSPVAMPRGAVEAIERHAGGNPLVVTALIEQMVREVRERGASELVDMLATHEREGEFIGVLIPKVIRQSLELRLRELQPLARAVLECGSNSGWSFCAWGVSKVLEIQQIEVEEVCRAMCETDQLLRESSLYVFPDGSVTPVYSFRNPLYARLLLASQSHARRDQIQQRFTEAVEQFWGDDVGSVALEMAERFEAVWEWSRALHYAKLAVANAARSARNRDTASLLQRGLRLSDHLPVDRRASAKDYFLRQLT
jgi:DNA-binding winged helix-turn-helix (wHTH) protein